MPLMRDYSAAGFARLVVWNRVNSCRYFGAGLRVLDTSKHKIRFSIGTGGGSYGYSRSESDEEAV